MMAPKRKTATTRPPATRPAPGGAGKKGRYTTLSVLDMPQDMRDAWQWVVALYACDHGNPFPLGKLIADGRLEIPAALRGAIANVVLGTRPPNLKAYARVKVEPHERIEIAAEISNYLGQIDRNLADAEAIADEHRMEVAEVRREMNGYKTQLVNDYAARLNVSVESIEDWLRDLRDCIGRWPRV